jgi:hypothetical protein
MNSWNTLPESYHERVYINTLGTVKLQIQQVENPTASAVNSTGQAHVGNAILLEYSTSELALEQAEITSTDLNIPIDNNCMDDELHFRMPGGCEDYHDEGDEIDKIDANRTASWRQRAATELERVDLGTSDEDGYEGNDGEDVDPDEEEEASPAHDRFTETMEE